MIEMTFTKKSVIWEMSDPGNILSRQLTMLLMMISSQELQKFTIALNDYITRLKNFAELARRLPSFQLNETNQTELIVEIDRILEVDKALQDLYKQISQDLRVNNTLDRSIEEIKDNIIKHIAKKKFAIDRQMIKVEWLKRMLAISDGIDSDAILAQLQRISLTSAPPSGWDHNMPLLSHRPPYPTEDLLRSGTLFEIMNVRRNNRLMNQMDTKNITQIGDKSLSFDDKKINDESNATSFDLDLNPDLI